MSASDRGTATDYSKGIRLRPLDLLTADRLLAVLALAGAVLLVIAELSPLYTVVVGALQTPQRSVSAGSNHGYALAVVALAAVAMTVGAVRGARAAAVALLVLGLVALFVALVVDLPDTRASGTLRESVAFSQARAQAARGFTLEIAGAIALLAAGAGLLAGGRFARAQVGPRRDPSRRDPPRDDPVRRDPSPRDLPPAA
jgi:hypothetical protein